MVIIAFLGNSINTRLASRQSTPKYLSVDLIHVKYFNKESNLKLCLFCEQWIIENKATKNIPSFD